MIDHLKTNLYPNALPLDYNIFYSEQYNKKRRIKIIIFSNALCKYKQFKTLPYTKQMLFLKDLEEGCYNEACKQTSYNNFYTSWESEQFINFYNDICYDKICNIEGDDIDNSYFIKQLFDGKIKPCEVGSLKSKDMCPHIYEIVENKIKERFNIDINNNRKVSTLQKCRRCKKYSVIMTKVYSRAFDECTPLKYTCTNCSFEWGG